MPTKLQHYEKNQFSFLMLILAQKINLKQTNKKKTFTAQNINLYFLLSDAL